jgi:hypothetical protein
MRLCPTYASVTLAFTSRPCAAEYIAPRLCPFSLPLLPPTYSHNPSPICTPEVHSCPDCHPPTSIPTLNRLPGATLPPIIGISIFPTHNVLPLSTAEQITMSSGLSARLPSMAARGVLAAATIVAFAVVVNTAFEPPKPAFYPPHASPHPVSAIAAPTTHCAVPSCSRGIRTRMDPPVT